MPRSLHFHKSRTQGESMRFSTSVLLYVLLVIIPTSLVTWMVYHNQTILESNLLNLLWISGTTVAVAVILLILPRFLPVFSEDWRDYAPGVGVDLFHAVFSTAIGKALADAVVIGIVSAVALVLGQTNEWETALGLQFALGLVIGEFGTYWAHRGLHHSPRMWPIHAVHHSPERMSSLSAGRTHPLNTVIAWTSQATLLLLFGFHPAVIIGIAMLTSLNGLVQHCNLDIRLGRLEYFIAGPTFHRWHHSKNPEHYRRNLASNLSFFDWIFGTMHLPIGIRPDEDVGVPDTAVTRGSNSAIQYLGHLITPFRYWRWVRETKEKER